ncbi:MAG: PAS domain S-box protein [Candidatus Hodarchaeales archaeon]|jgi:PAS domain S-box-containing protein
MKSRILLVDDDEDHLFVTKRLLERKEPTFELTTTVSAPEALQILEKEPFDAVVADYQMVGMDGLELLKAIRTSGNEVSFIIFTGRGREEVAIQALNLGADYYLRKGDDPVIQYKELMHILRTIIDHKRTKDEKKAAEQKYRDLLENINDVIFRVSENGIIDYVSPPVKSLIGYQPSEMIGKPFTHLIPPADISRAAKIMENVLSGKIRTYEYRLSTKSGDICWIRASLKPIIDGNRVVGLQGVATDITESKRAEEAIQASERWFRNIFEKAPISMSLYNSTGNIVDANQACLELRGASSLDDLEQFNLFDEPTMTNEIKQKILQKDFQFISYRAFYDFDEVQQRKLYLTEKADIAFMEITIASLVDDMMDSTIGYLVISQDITDQKVADQVLQESEELYRDVVQDQTELVCRFLPGGILTFVNDAFCRYFDKTRGELMGTSVFHNFSEENRDTMKELIGKLSSENPVVTAEIRVVASNREEDWQQWTSRVIVNQDGKIFEYQSVSRDITERKHMEMALQAEEEKYRTLVEQTSQGIAITCEGRIVFANSAATKITGYAVEELLALSPEGVGRIIHPEDQDFVLGYMRDRLAGLPAPEQYEFRMIRKDSAIRWVEVYVEVIEYQGKPAIQRLIIDITERKQMERALEEEEKKYRTLVEQSLQGIAIIQMDRVLFANPAFEEMTGYTFEKMASLTAEVIMHPDDRERALSLLQDRLAGKPVPPHHEYRLIRKDETIAWVETFATRIEFEGSPAAQIAFIDITDRKKAEAALQESETRFRDLANLLPQTLFETDLQGHFIYTNRHGVETFGYTLDEVTDGLMVPDVLILEDRERVGQNMAKLLRGEKRPGAEYTAVRRDGSIFPILIFASPIVQNGKPIGFRGVSIDISDLKKAEEALRKSEHEKALILKSTSDVVVYQDRRLKIIWANDAASQYIGKTPEEMVGKYCYEVWRQQTEPCTVCPVLDALETGEAQEKENTTPDGRSWIDRGYPVRDEDGEIIGAVEVATDITELKKAEEALRESEERFRRLAENAQDLIFRVQIKPFFRYDYMSPAIEQISGYRPEEYYADPQLGLKTIHPDDLRELEALREDPEKNIDGKPVILRWIHRNGEVRWTEDRSTQVVDEEGNIIALEGVTRNITDQKATEEALRESEEKYRNLIEQSVQGLVIIQDGRIVFANSVLERISGFTLEEIYNLSAEGFMELVHPDDRDELLRRLNERVQEIPATPGFETRIRDKEGNYRWISTIGTRIEFDGQPAIQAAFLDITERKLAENELRESEEKYRDLVENISDVVYATDETGIITYISPPIEAISGYEPSEIIGKPFVEHIHPDDRRQTIEQFQSDSSNQTMTSEYRFLTKTGVFRWVRCSAKTISVNNQFAGLQGVITDITEQKRTEILLQQQKAELSEFAHAMAHDLRSKIHNIQGYASLLEDKHEPGLAQKVIDLAQSMNDLLVRSVALAEAGQVIEKTDEMNFTTIIRSGGESIPAEIEFYYDVLPTVSCDPDKVTLIFQNLFENAVIHGKPTKIEVRKVATKTHLDILVSNNGQEIPAKIRPLIFNRGFSTKEGGSGLGLAIVKKIIEAHGWQIKLDETPEITFRIAIPNSDIPLMG